MSRFLRRTQRNPGWVDTHKSGTFFSACNTSSIWGSVFLRGNITGKKKESTSGILGEAFHRWLDRTDDSNRILIWLQLYKQLQNIAKSSVVCEMPRKKCIFWIGKDGKGKNTMSVTTARTCDTLQITPCWCCPYHLSLFCLLWIFMSCTKPTGSLHAISANSSTVCKIPSLTSSPIQVCASPQPPEVFPISVFLAVILMVYPPGYYSNLIQSCCSWEKTEVSKSKIGISLLLIFFMVKNISLLRCEGMLMLWTSSRLCWKTFFIVSQRCSNWISLISSASLFHSCISSQETLSLAFALFVLDFVIGAVMKKK